jgi:uncharacterized protein (DUF2062 family)
MVQVGGVAVGVLESLVPMGVRVWCAGRVAWRVQVLVVLIVRV